jgi:D-3-phosphoglycerate dehydrogenase
MQLNETRTVAYSGDVTFLRRIFQDTLGYSPKIYSLHQLLQAKSRDRLSEIDLVWVLTEPKVDSFLLNHFPNLQFLLSSTTGLTHIDVEELRNRGIKLFSLRDFPTEMSRVSSSSEHTWLLVMAVWRRLLQHDANPTFMNISNSRYEFPFTQLQSRTLGLVGFGRIGRNLAKYGACFGMNIIAFDPYISGSDIPNIRHVQEITELLREADIVVLAASKVNRGPILGRSELLQMKMGSMFVNISRGSLVDEVTLRELLVNGQIMGVALDVFDSEENDNSPIKILDWITLKQRGYNLVLTPHIGGSAVDAIDEVHRILVKLDIFKFEQTV